MSNWYECSIKYDKLNNEGVVIKVAEKVLVLTESYSDVEAQIINSMGQYTQGLIIGNIKKVFYEDVLHNEIFEYWFKAKVIFKEVNESGKEKKTPKTFILSASNFIEATNTLNQLLEAGYISDTYIYSISLTNISGVIKG